MPVVLPDHQLWFWNYRSLQQAVSDRNLELESYLTQTPNPHSNRKGQVQPSQHLQHETLPDSWPQTAFSLLVESIWPPNQEAILSLKWELPKWECPSVPRKRRTCCLENMQRIWQSSSQFSTSRFLKDTLPCAHRPPRQDCYPFPSVLVMVLVLLRCLIFGRSCNIPRTSPLGTPLCYRTMS
jgi:hypothetical protein